MSEKNPISKLFFPEMEDIIDILNEDREFSNKFLLYAQHCDPKLTIKEMLNDLGATEEQRAIINDYIRTYTNYEGLYGNKEQSKK